MYRNLAAVFSVTFSLSLKLQLFEWNWTRQLFNMKLRSVARLISMSCTLEIPPNSYYRELEALPEIPLMCIGSTGKIHSGTLEGSYILRRRIRFSLHKSIDPGRQLLYVW
jgi:hypothetical protein